MAVARTPTATCKEPTLKRGRYCDRVHWAPCWNLTHWLHIVRSSRVDLLSALLLFPPVSSTPPVPLFLVLRPPPPPTRLALVANPRIPIAPAIILIARGLPTARCV